VDLLARASNGRHNVLRAGGWSGTILRMVSSETGTAFEIRRAAPDDWAALRQVRLAALAEAPYAFGSTLDREIDRPEQLWRDRIAAWPQFIAWAGGEPVGIAAGFAEPAADDGARGGWHLVSMWVSPQARGLGIADELVAAVSASARADGAQRLTLWVTDVNARAMAFYQRMGFRSTGGRQLVRPEEPDHWEQEQALDLS
jgi:ribosomal protein S18 acetylase RimI-like enzyme